MRSYAPLIAALPNDDLKAVGTGLLENVRANSLTSIQKNLDSHTHGHAWKATENGGMVAYVDNWCLDSAMGYVNNIFVLPEYRRQGIATRLMDAAENWAAGWGATRMKLQSMDLLREAHAMYLKRGYIHIGTTDYPESPEAKMLQFEKQISSG